MQFKNNQFSLASHTYIDYECDAGKLSVNAGLREVKFQFGDLEMGRGTFQMGLSHIYSTKNHIVDTYMGNNWKLNIQQYVIPYQSSYYLEGFQDGDYIYIDEYNHIHRFKQYDRGWYVDQSGTGLVLIADSYTRQIKDNQNNCLNFNQQGRLTEIITMGRSNLPTKFIKYDSSGKIERFYDGRKEERYFKFEYKNDLLYKISLIDKDIEKESVYYNYEGTNLQSVYTFVKDKLAHISMFKYDSCSNLVFATGTSNGRAVEVEYASSQLKVKEGISKINMKSVQVLENDEREQPKIGESCKHILYVANTEIYLGDNEYLFDIIHDNTAVLDSYECFNINLLLNDNLISYFSSYTDVLTKKDKTYRYYKNCENTILSQFEVNGNALMTLKKDTGQPLMCDTPKEYSGITLNRKRVICRDLNKGICCFDTFTDNIFEYDFKNNQFTEYYKSKGSCFLNYKLSFWIKHNSSNAKYMKIRVEYENEIRDYKNEKYIDHLATNAWQEVEISLPVKDDQQKNRLGLRRIAIYVETDGSGAYEISNVRCDGSSNTYLEFRRVQITYPKFPNYYRVRLLKTDASSETILLGKENFITENDILQSMINKDSSISNKFDFIYNNGKKRVANVTNVYFKVVEYPEHIGLNQEYECDGLSILELGTYSVTNQKVSYRTYKVVQNDLIAVNTINNNQSETLIQDKQGRVIWAIDSYGKKTVNEYDDYGNLLSTMIAKKEDFDSNNKFISDRKRFYLLYAYNDETDSGRYRETPISVKNEECNIEYLLDSDNKIVGIKSGENSYQNYSYDGINRLTAVSNNNQSNFIEYDAYGNIKAFRDHKNTYVFDLDEYGNIQTTSIKVDDVKQKIYEEKLESNLSDTIISKNHLTGSSNHIYYDDYGRPTCLEYEENNGKVNVEFTYQQQGDVIGDEAYANPFSESPSVAQVKSLFDGYSNMETTFIYDNNNQKKGYKTTRSNQNYLSVVKEDAQTTKYHIGSIEYKRFDTINRRLEKIEYGTDTDNKFSKFSYEYEYHPVVGAISKRKSATSEVNYIYERTDGSHYYSMGIQEIKQNFGSKNFNYEYKYNQDMNLIKVFSEGFHPNTISYSYDTLGRIYKEGNLSVYKDFEYQYNDFNRLSKILLNNQSYKTFTYDSLGRIKKCMAYNNTLTEYTYIGKNLNPSSIYKKGTYNTCNFIRNGLLSSYGKYCFGYSASGLRTYKYDGTSYTWYYYAGDKLLGEDLPNGAKVRYFYDEQGILGARYYASNGSIQDYEYVKDGQNNVIAIMKGTEVVAEYRYDAWGNILEEWKDSYDSFAKINPIRYRSYYYDIDTGYYYLQSRYYDPEIGAFISSDTVDYLNPERIGDLNLYTYCGNNPVMNIDPSGHAWYHILAWVIAAVAVVATGIAVMVFSGGSAMVALTAVMSASLGVASSSMALTISSFAFVGATLGFIGASMWAARSGNMEEAGPEVLFSTVTGGLYGAYGGYISYQEQIGNSNNCGLMTPYERRKQREAEWQARGRADGTAKPGYQISHPYGVYGNNRNYYEVVTTQQHKEFHKMYGYKTNGGQFIRKNPNFHNIWEWLKWL